MVGSQVDSSCQRGMTTGAQLNGEGQKFPHNKPLELTPPRQRGGATQRQTR